MAWSEESSVGAVDDGGVMGLLAHIGFPVSRSELLASADYCGADIALVQRLHGLRRSSYGSAVEIVDDLRAFEATRARLAVPAPA